MGKQGVASATAEGLAKAKKVRKPVEVPDANTETTTVYANPNGTVTRVISQLPVRLRNSDGDLVKVDHSLKKSGKRLTPAVSPAAVSVSATGSGELASLDPEGPGSLSMSFGDSLGAPTVDGDTATYPVAGDDSAEVTASTNSLGFAVRVNLSEVPESATSGGDGPEYRFPMALKGLTPRLVDTTTGVAPAQRLEFVNAGGEVVAASGALVMWDASVAGSGEPSNRVAVATSLVTDNGAPVLVLKPSAAWLSDPDTQYPVVVDPDVSSVQKYGDASVASNAPSTVNSNGYLIRAGKELTSTSSPVWRAFSMFTIDQYIGKVIVDAKLNLFQAESSTCTATNRYTYVAPAAPRNTPNLTYGLDTKTDVQWRSPYRNDLNGNGNSSTGGPACAPNDPAIVNAGLVSFDVTKTMTALATGAAPSDVKAAGQKTTNDTQNLAVFRIAASDESSPSFSTAKSFCSLNRDGIPSDSPCLPDGRTPTLSITYIPDLGVAKSFALDKRSLDSRSQLSINQDGGNAVLQSRDFSIKGVGQDLTVDRYYNSGYPTPPSTSLGTTGWNFGFGADVAMEATAYDSLRLVYHAPDGHTYGPYIRKSYTPSNDPNNDYNKFESIKYGDVDADLTSDGATTETLTLTVHDSQLKYYFQKKDSTTDSYYLVKSTDRNGNYIFVDYLPYSATAANNHRIDKMTIVSNGQTSGRVVTFSYNADGYVSQISDANGPTTRLWKYFYNSNGGLTKFTDPTGADTIYGYTTYTIGARTRQLLTSITNPAKSDGNKPETRIEYTAGQATRVLLRVGAGTSDFATFTYNYYSRYGGGCPARADRYSIRVDNKNAGHTTYCFADRQGDSSGGDGSAATDVLDNYGNRQSTTYNPDSKITSAISPSNQGSGSGGATKVSYGADSSGLMDQVDTVTAPANGEDSSKAGKETYKYKASSSIPGYKYLPSSKLDANAICTSYRYYSSSSGGGAVGRISIAYLGADTTTASGNKDCSPNTASNAWYATYNPNGSLATTWDSNAPSASASPAYADRTQYFSYAASETGSGGPNGGGLLKEVAKPGGNCAAPPSTSRKLCTTYTYDGLGRVLTITDGRGKVTTNTYDKNDRITQTLFDSATSCTLSAGTCIKYSYDDEGNLYQRQDAAGTTTISWTWLNQQLTQTTPDGSSTTNSWDASSNLLQYDQTVKVGSSTYNDTVGYTYDDANRVTTITDNPGTSSARVIKTDRDADGRLFRTRFITPQVSNSFGYTDSGAIATASAEPTSGGVNQQFVNFKYDYNDEDKEENETTLLQNIHAITFPGAGTSNLDYDYSLNRLINVRQHVNDVKLWEYVYDVAGNMRQYNINPGTTSASTSYYGVDGSGNLCWGTDVDPGAASNYHATGCPTAPSGGTTTTYNQDAAGNNTGSTALPITYNALNQASSINGETKSYLDKDNNLLTGSGTGSIAKNYSFGTLGLTASSGATGAPTFYTRDTDGRILDSHGPGGYFYYLLDGQKSVVGLVDDSGVLQGVYTYNPFGGTSIKNADGSTPTGTTPLTINPFRYRSGFTENSGLYHFGARFYNPSTMRWTQPDPKQGKLSDPATLNSFGYSGNDPINHSDASGEDFNDFLKGAADVAGRVGAALGAAATVEGLFEGTALGLLIGGVIGPVAVGLTITAVGIAAYYGAGDFFDAVGQASGQ